MDSSEKLKLLENHIKALCPTFEVRFKDESLLMKTLGKVMFFNKSFMTHFITTLGTKVYFPNRQRYEEDSENSFRILAHEFVHIMDFMKSPWKFVFSYAAPQILAKLCIFSLLFFISPYFLLFLLSLLFLAPIPSIGRKNIEIRGYSMNCKIIQWCDECYPSDEYLDGCVDRKSVV